MPGHSASRDAAWSGVQRPPRGEVVYVAYRGHLRNLAMIVRHRPGFVAVVYGLLIALTVVSGSGGLSLALVVLLPLELSVAMVLAGVIVALHAWTGQGRHTLHWADIPAGRAMGLTHTPRRHPTLWVVTDVFAVRTRGVAPPAHQERAGYQVMNHIIGAADAAGRELRLTASHPDVATKLYERLGFTITGKDRLGRPTMHRPPREP